MSTDLIEIDLPLEVIGTSGMERAIVVSVNLQFNDEVQAILYENFIKDYREYMDPKQIEINRLNKVIEDLKLKAKKTRVSKPRRTLTPLERQEIRQLIENGESNTPIAIQYGVGDSTVSKIRCEMRKAGEDV